MTTNPSLSTLDLDGVRRILCVAAHPDDLEYGISAAVAAWTAAGIEVDYLLLTSGEAGMQREPEIVGPLRAREQSRACEIVGVNNLKICDFPDGHLEPGLPLRRAIARSIRKRRPDIVVTSNFEMEVPWGLNHVDHRIVGEAVVDAIRDAGTRWIHRELLDDGLEPHVTQRLLIGGYPDERCNVYVDVTGGPLRQGIDSLNAHEEYLADLLDHPAPEDFLPEMAHATGRRVGVKAAIGFREWPM
ncbi:PIG-L domain-containing protein [Corynebacterium yudongzhengii]|uniref:PIG-L family deacetylase n=1 Tax=Corynebacterium yudongzhengii TaxID=2080740 RepID=A0A2U1T7E5_9CORY|nr:PIG-L deacetylase family protein [Corynebacterium yudongzhengii]AWB81517.1 PIG-L domain-containing protein [Corynebacterium yudongzhengii]PWC01912.1 PIG-L family deacetylase [Corynebacterium yudongzhengii]